MLLQMTLFHSFLCLSVSLCVYPFICKWTGCFHDVAIINRAAINIKIHVYFSISVLCRYMSSSRTFGYGGSIFSFLRNLILFLDFPGGSDGKASAYNAGDLGLIPELGRSPREGDGNPLQYSCLENPMDGGAW